VTCVRCGGAMTSRRGTHRYTETGLSNVVLVDVEMRACPACGERELVTPRIDALHRAIARALSRQTGALMPEAVRFLRRWLGLTIHCFARLIGVRHQTVCRWERLNTTCPLTPPVDRLLKMLVAQHDPTGPYPLDLFTREQQARPAPIRLVSPDWRVDVPDR
jgi:putative zinc finger/helix-turn-helix YgiT family protein